jgi:ribosomal protein L40E
MPLLPNVFADVIIDEAPRYHPWYSYILGTVPFVVGLLSVVIAVFIFVDALRHKRNFIFWPLAVILSGVIIGFPATLFGLSGFTFTRLGAFIGPIAILVFYLATKKEEGLEYEEEDFLAQGIRRAYFYIFSFVTFGILFFGIADLIRVILDFNWGGQAIESFGRTFSITRDSFSRNVSFRLATIIVTLPIWFFHWFHLETNLSKIEDPYELRITFRTHKSYLYLVSGITLVVVIIFGIWFVYQFLNLLLGVSDIRLQSLAAPVGYTLTALVTFVYHFSILRSRRFQEVEKKVAAFPPPIPPRPAEAKVVQQKSVAEKFCPKCGTKNTSSSNFCTSCGTKLS